MQLASGLRIDDLKMGNKGLVYSRFYGLFGWDYKTPCPWPDAMEHAYIDFMKLEKEGILDKYPEDAFCYLTYRTGIDGGNNEATRGGVQVMNVARGGDGDPLYEIIKAWRLHEPGIIQALGLRLSMARGKVLTY